MDSLYKARVMQCNRRRDVVSIYRDTTRFSPQWLNNIEILEHEGGDMPFEAEISKELKRIKRDSHRLTVAVNNNFSFRKRRNAASDTR